MSLSSIQIQKVLSGLARFHFSAGEKPRSIDLLREMSEFFSKYPPGTPLPIPRGILGEGLKSDPEDFNQLMGHTITNLELLYNVLEEQVQESMNLTSFLQSQMERLRAKRRALVARIDDYLFTMSNTDGYFYSFSDTFNDIANTDISLTSAFVDTATGAVTLPLNNNMTRVMPGSSVGNVQLKYVADGVEINSGVNKAPFSGCLDGLSNTVWSTEIITNKPQEIVCTVDMAITGTGGSAKISKIEYDPYGITPVQSYAEVLPLNKDDYVDFGDAIKESVFKVAYAEAVMEVTDIRITLRKTKPDIVDQTELGTSYRYIFGAKNITLIEQVFDNEAVWISAPISISEDLQDEHVIDSVAISVDDETPTDTSIDYYVAVDTITVDSQIGDFDWKAITPLNTDEPTAEMIASFSGAASQVRFIREDPTGSDLKLIEEDPLNPDSHKRNPFSYQGVTLWRICEFKNEDPIPASLKLEEGINTTRILYTNYDAKAIDLDFWVPYVNGTRNAQSLYGRIDTGNNFFWGGDVGENYKAVYVETYLESITSQNLNLKRLVKLDDNSRQWEVKVFLNGVEIGHLPVGTDEAILPWKFQEGLNHICMTILIPRPTVNLHPNEGAINLLGDEQLFSFGKVKLGSWAYADLFQVMNNEVGDSKTFTIFKDGDTTQLVSRRKPTANLQLFYSTPSSAAPQRIRVRADLKRSNDNFHISPALNSYRVRFRYA